MAEKQFLVLGSGPSGVAVCAELIAAGCKPIMIDGGIEPDHHALTIKRQLATESPRSIAADSGHVEQAPASPGQKAWFGSYAPYEQPAVGRMRYRNNLQVRASYGVGGYSRIWGGTFAFHTDYSRWPRTAIPENVDIDRVRDLVPHGVTTWDDANAGRTGYLPGAPASGESARRFMHADIEDAWNVQPSIVAISSDYLRPNACRGCGRCLTGCPYDSIWCAADQVQDWVRTGLLDYRPGFIVDRVSEIGETVVVQARDASGSTTELRADRAYLACGPISTAGILINSGCATSVTIRDTATAFSAALRIGKPRPADPQTHHGLSQWWVSRRDREDFLAQVYPPDVTHADKLLEKLPAGGRHFSRQANYLAGQLHPIISYLGCDDSDPLILRRSGGGIEVMGYTKKQTKAKFKAHLRELYRTLRKAGYLVPPGGTQFTPPGTGLHIGSSFPHGSATDQLGRLAGLARTHIVDASVLPFIQVGSITPTAMANAVRIARQSFHLDSQS